MSLRQRIERSRQARGLRIGGVLGLALRTWFRRFLALHLVAAVCILPLLAVSAGRTRAEACAVGMSGAWYSAWYLAERLPANLSSPGKLCLLGYAWHFAVLVLGMRIAYGALGPRAGGTGLGALGRLVPYAIGALALLVVLDQIVVRGPLRVPDASVPSFLFMTLLELAFGAALALVAPAAADGHGLRLALRRGWQLARGSRLRLAVLLVLFAFLHWVMFELTLVRSPWVLVANALVVVFKACVLAAAYAKLRGREGPRPEDLGAIFA